MRQSASSNALGLLSSEAGSLLDQAKTYRAMMEALGPDDPRRSVYETVIRDLLERSRRLSSVVVTTSSSST
jgi:hypothetical protein